jgi:hypothetical protein
LQARETIATSATAAPTAPPQLLLDPENWPPILDDADAPDLESILDSVYRAPQGEAPAAEALAGMEPLGEAAQTFPLVIIEPPVVRVKMRRRRKRRTPLVEQVRENQVARRTIYALWAGALVVLVWALLQMAR